jgi:pyrroline-5-carboxylate reductase
VWLEDEAQFDLVTALAGSGPGFVYRFIDALAGADRSGLTKPRPRASRWPRWRAPRRWRRLGCRPRNSADRVASPGGMTREGLNVLDDGAALRRC